MMLKPRMPCCSIIGGLQEPLVAPGALGRRGVLQVVRAAKGFGPQRQRSRTTDDDEDDEVLGAQKRARRKNIRKQMATSMPSTEQREAMQGQAFQAVQELERARQQAEEDLEFAAKLSILKAEGEEKRKVLPPTAGAGPSSGAARPPTPPRAAFDEAPADIYANPPSIADTLITQLNSDVSDPKLRSMQFGPNQLGVAAGAIIFGLVFVLVSGGDYTPSNRFKGVRPVNDVPDPVQEGIIKGRIALLEQQIMQQPGDTEATQALALSYAQLLDYGKAADLLDRLVVRDPNNPDAWRVGSGGVGACCTSLLRCCCIQSGVVPVCGYLSVWALCHLL